MIPGVSFPSLTAEHISAWLPPLSAWSAAQDHPFGYICIHDTPHLLWSPGWPPDSRAPQSHKSGKPSYSLEGLSGCMHQPREFVCPHPPPAHPPRIWISVSACTMSVLTKSFPGMRKAVHAASLHAPALHELSGQTTGPCPSAMPYPVCLFCLPHSWVAAMPTGCLSMCRG